MMLNFFSKKRWKEEKRWASNPKQLDDNNFPQEYYKDVTDFLNGYNLKPVHVYESLNEKSTQNKVLN